MLEAIVVYWDAAKNWGLLQPTAIPGERELFCHGNDVRGTPLKVGDKVLYEPRLPPHYTGRLRAVRVRLAS
jgi:cold shock CspA family protein